MSFQYEPSGSAELRQGELLANIWRLRPIWPAKDIPQNQEVAVEPIRHSWVIVLHADCDLLQDYNARAEAVAKNQELKENDPHLVPSAICCDAFGEPEMRARAPGSDFFRRVKTQQEQRYHALDSARVVGSTLPSMPALFLDFRRMFTLFTEDLYQAITDESVQRIGVIPPIHVHDLMHRFYGYLSRVGVPE